MPRCRYPLGNFPFPVPHVFVPPPGRVGVPLDVAMRWYWRVRTWQVKITASAVFEFERSGGHYKAKMSAASASDVVGRPALVQAPGYTLVTDSEANLTVGVALNSITNQRYVFGGSVSVTTPDQNLSGGIDNGYVIPSLYGKNLQIGFTRHFAAGAPDMVYCPDTNLYYPDLFLRTGLGVVSFSELYNTRSWLYFGSPFVYVPPLPGDDDPPRSQVDVLINIDGYTCTQIKGAYFESGVPQRTFTNPVFSGQSASFSMLPLSYWPYYNAQGVKLWDEATGAPAPNPATGVPWTLAEIAAADMP